MTDDTSKSRKKSDEEMTVVVPPAKGPKLSAESTEGNGDTAMSGVQKEEVPNDIETVDPKIKTVQGN